MRSLNLNIVNDVITAIGNSILWLLTQLWNAVIWLFKDVIYSFLKWVSNGFVWLVSNYPITTILIIICVVLIVCRLWHSFIKK